MKKRKTKKSQSRPILNVFIGLTILGLIIAILLQGKNVALFNPQGQIALDQFHLIMTVVILLFAIGIPTVALLFFTAWKYRESNPKAAYEPNASHGKLYTFSLALPAIFILTLASIMWPATHKLYPHKAIASDNKPLTIQVVAMRWKWLFIYPDQNIASVNYVQVPVGTPVQFDLTADEAPMSSFWIPQLGGQLYAMTGHDNLLNLMATAPGNYSGRSAEINGQGFAGMKFVAHASSIQDFNLWVQDTQLSSKILDTASYAQLLKPSENNPPAFYSMPQPDLYAKVLLKYSGSHNHAGQQ